LKSFTYLMQLYLVQHGEAVAKEIDVDRPLSTQGASDAKNVAMFLSDAGIKVKRIQHSGKTRAEQTAEIFADALEVKGQVTAISGINPNDAVAEFVGQLNEYTDDTMVVGHLPFMAKLVAQLITKEAETILTAYHPGSIVCLAKDEKDCWQIAWMLRPELFNNKK